ncbi:hypothetical protein [Enterococcus sp. GC40]|uniref:hypothetical protein n=1 Tax=Enterococcus sp. GC40 TaxID=3231359 RepID=UPI00349FE123
MGRGRTMKEIKIIFDGEDIHVQAEDMNECEFLNVLGSAFIASCEEFNIDPLSAIEILMDAEDAVEDGEDDEGDGSLWYDDSDECDNCGRPYVGCDCDDDVFWVEDDYDYCDGCGRDFADCECGCTDWGDV